MYLSDVIQISRKNKTAKFARVKFPRVLAGTKEKETWVIEARLKG